MRIGINGTCTLHGMRAIKRYTLNLIENLVNIDPDDEYVIFYNAFRKGFDRIPEFANKPNVSKVVCRIPGRILSPLWNTFNFPSIEAFIGKVDVFHSPGFDVPPQKFGKAVFTVHGLAYLKIPHLLDQRFCEQSRRLLAVAIKRADIVIAVSATNKEEITELFPYALKKVRTIPLGIGPEFHLLKRTETKPVLKEKFSIEKPYILYVGALEPHKGINELLKAYSMLCEQYHIDLQLVLVGPKSWYYKEIIKKIEEFKLQNRVIFTGYIGQETNDLSILYNGADLFAFPSFYEGWASPPLEAMACGVPVVTSRVSSLPETVGDAALLFDPYNVEEIADAMYRCLTDTVLRDGLRKKGVERVKEFTWERMSRETLRIYKEIYS